MLRPAIWHVHRKFLKVHQLYFYLNLIPPDVDSDWWWIPVGENAIGWLLCVQCAFDCAIWARCHLGWQHILYTNRFTNTNDSGLLFLGKVWETIWKPTWYDSRRRVLIMTMAMKWSMSDMTETNGLGVSPGVEQGGVDKLQMVWFGWRFFGILGVLMAIRPEGNILCVHLVCFPGARNSIATILKAF